MTKRPVTFFYNGGPGSSTVWLHLGSFGPKRLAAAAPSTTTVTPFPLVDNAESLLDVSDLVFVDAVGSGLSQAIAPNTNRSFWGVDADAAVFRDFVRRYVKVNGRDASLKFLFGESYGTTRSAVLTNLLESAGVSLAGVVLQSSVLNYNTNCAQTASSTVRCASYIPSYGATGAWFGLTTPIPNAAALPGVINGLRTLANNELNPAQGAFLSSGVLPSNDLLTRLSAATGITFARWQTHVNLPPDYFQANLISGQLLGRYDARVTAATSTFLASEGDPSSTFITASFVSTIASYLPGTLKYCNPSNYTTLSNAIQTWDFTHDGQALPDTIPDLAAAFAHNPKLKVLALNGYHDLPTPFFQTELDLARLGVNPNVQNKFYSGGHMTYLDDSARAQQKADLVQFYQSALAQQALRFIVKKLMFNARRLPLIAIAALLMVLLFASGAEALTTSADAPMRDPWVPAETRKAAAAAPTPVETSGAALQRQVERKLKKSFDDAIVGNDGTLTAAQAEAAGLGFVVKHFNEIDQRKAGAVRFEDVTRFMNARGGRVN